MHSLFAPIFSDGTIVVEAEVHLADDRLFPEELACVRRAVATRRAQFGTGRICARRALAMLGLPERPLVKEPSGAPAWPKGVVGSITHTSRYCAAVVKPCPPWRSVGIDAEELQALGPDMVGVIATEAERRWLASLPAEIRHDYAVLLFSAKEAYYKLQHPVEGRFLEFHEVEIEVDEQSRTFCARARVNMPAGLAEVSGRFSFAAGKILCGLELPA